MRGSGSIARAVATSAATLLCSACFTVQHPLPAGSYFGTLPAAASRPGRASGERFDAEASKNWFLAGLVSYTDFGIDDLAPKVPANAHIEKLEVETRFSEYDVFISILPGLFYGYYVWAPRTVHIKGQVVLDE